MNFFAETASAFKRISIRAAFFIFSLLLISASVRPAFSATLPFDHSLWDRFLKTVVTEDGRVDYELARSNQRLLEDYLEQLQFVDTRDFQDNWPREEKLAFLLNAYNAGVVKMVLDHYPVQSLQDVPGAWDLPVIRVGKWSWSLNQLRQGELLETFRDEKIHTALACGAVSCPRLESEAFTGLKVEGQLYRATKKFVNDEKFNVIDPEQNKIVISQLFKWYGDDFTLDFGFHEGEESDFSPEENAVLSFLAYYLDDPAQVEFLRERDFKIRYLPFDWSLNQAEQKTAS